MEPTAPPVGDGTELIVDVSDRQGEPIANGHAPAAQPLVPPARVSLHHTFSRPQLRVAVQGAAEGVPVVLSHALGLDLSMWDRLAAQLADAE